MTSSVNSGVLTVTSDASDAIAITCVGGQVKVGGENPATGAATCGTISAIDVTGGPGDNAITLTGVTAALFPAITSVSIDGGAGADTIAGSEFVDELRGGNENFTVNPSATAGRVQFDRDAQSAGGAFNLDIGTSERLDMNANAGNDTFSAGGALDALGFRLDVDGGAGDDSLDCGDGADLLDGGNDTSVVNGAGGDERFTVNPSATAGRVLLDRTDPAPFNVDIGTTENLLVNAAGGDDRIRGSKRLAGLIASTFNGDDGNDRIRGTGGEDVLSGGKGFDLINSIDKAADSVQCATAGASSVAPSSSSTAATRRRSA